MCIRTCGHELQRYPEELMMPAGGNEGLAWCCPYLAVDLGLADARCLVDVVVAVDGLNYGFRIEIGVVDAGLV